MMGSRSWQQLSIVAALILCAPLVLVAFTNIAIGDKVANRSMPTLEGEQAMLLSDSEAGVFVFFRPSHEHSLMALQAVGELHREFEDRPLSWTAIVSNRSSAEISAAELEALGSGVVVLVDEGDALYAELGVRLHPVIGVVDSEHLLADYQPFAKVGLKNRLRAEIHHALGDFDDAELEAALNPAIVESHSSAVIAQRNLKLATKLFDAGNYEKAAERARVSLGADPTLAGAHALLGSIAAATGDCVAARESFERALELDAEEASAIAGLEACAGD